MLVYRLRLAPFLAVLVLLSSALAEQKKGKSDLIDQGLGMEISQGTFYLLQNAPLQVSNFHAMLRKGNQAPTNLFVNSGQIFLPSDTLTQIMDQQMQGQKDVSDLKFSTSGQQVKIQGKMKKVVPIPFTITGNVQTTPEGKIEIHTTSVDAGKLPVGGVMDLFGIQVKDVTGKVQQRAVSLQGDNLLLDLEKISGKITFLGHVQQVQVQEKGLLLDFGGANVSEQRTRSSSSSGHGKSAKSSP